MLIMILPIRLLPVPGSDFTILLTFSVVPVFVSAGLIVPTDISLNHPILNVDCQLLSVSMLPTDPFALSIVAFIVKLKIMSQNASPALTTTGTMASPKNSPIESFTVFILSSPGTFPSKKCHKAKTGEKTA